MTCSPFRRTILLACVAGVLAAVPGRPAGAQIAPAVEDSARSEMARGRAWHAARLIEEGGGLAGLTPGQTLLLARAESGWKNQEAVRGLLRGQSWLAEFEDAEGLSLLAGAEASIGRLEEAGRLYRTYEALTPDARAAALTRSRMARVLARSGDFSGAFAALDRMQADPAILRHWTALEVAREAARDSLPDAVRTSRAHASGEAYARGWVLEAEAFVRAGDTTSAVRIYRDRLNELESTARRAWARMALGELLHQTGDTAAARTDYLRSLRILASGASAVRSGRGLLRLGIEDAEIALSVARSLAGAGDSRRAVEAYDRAFMLSGGLTPEQRFARARLLPGLDRHEEAIGAFRELEKSDDTRLQLRVLDTWVDVRRAQGRRDAARTVQGWILERFPESDQAAEIHFFRGDALQDRGALNDAAAAYRRAYQTGSSSSYAGLSWMRHGQLEFGRGRFEEAGAVYGAYLDAYPEGRRREQAEYWVGRSLAGQGRDAEAAATFETLAERQPTSYYAVLAAGELGRTYGSALPALGVKQGSPTEVISGLETLDLLMSADLGDAVGWWVSELRRRAEGTPARLALAEGLIERGFTIEGIRIGQALVSEGIELDGRLMRVLYPFPHREVIMAEAAERDVDPFLVAGLIRQESAFDPDIVSRAGAIGLMQVMPATGRELARAERIRGFTPESLETPEINVHLGVNFWLDLERSFSGEHIPLRLSAYNAGPTRARRWRQLPENADPLRFTERIPFEETRGYVKNVTRNAALYRALYGDALPPIASRLKAESSN